MNQHQKSLFSRALWALFFVTASACANTVVMVPRMSPAEINLVGYKRIAIGGVGGQDGDKIVTALSQALTDTQRFEVLDRQHLGAITKEQDFSISGRVSDESAISIGQMIGSGALLVGDVLANAYTEDVVAEKSTCLKDGKQKPCTEYTRSAKATLSVAFKVLDTETGKVLAAKTVDAGMAQSRKNENTPPPVFDSKEAWMTSCRKQVVDDFMKVIAPYQMNVSVELLDDSDLPELEVGNNFAKIGKWADAILQYNTAIKRAKKNKDIDKDVQAKAFYNLGMGLSLSGNYDAGVAELERAYSLEPSDMFLGQIQRIKQFKIDDARLAEQRAAAEQATR